MIYFIEFFFFKLCVNQYNKFLNYRFFIHAYLICKGVNLFD